MVGIQTGANERDGINFIGMTSFETFLQGQSHEIQFTGTFVEHADMVVSGGREAGVSRAVARVIEDVPWFRPCGCVVLGKLERHVMPSTGGRRIGKYKQRAELRMIPTQQAGHADRFR